MNVYDIRPAWFGAEGQYSSGKPVMIRGRQFPDTLIAHPSLPFVLMLTYEYPIVDDSELPSAEQYNVLNEFEKRTLDVLEGHREGIAAFVRTGRGSVRYAFYVPDIDRAASILNEHILDDDPIAISAKEDPSWSEYASVMQALKPSP